MKYIVRTTLFSVEGAVETPIAEDDSPEFTDYDDAVEEFEACTESSVDDCLLESVDDDEPDQEAAG